MHYRLSKRQLREIRVRGREITIVIPDSLARTTPSATEFARQMLPENAGEVKRARFETIAIDPYNNSPDLAGLLGVILHDWDRLADTPHMIVDVCRVILAPACLPRGHNERPQWPAVMVNGEFSWPKCYREATADAS